MPPVVDHYRVLHVNPDADADVISAAYKSLVKKAKGDDRRLKLLNAAVDVLGDPKRRADYDQSRRPKDNLVGEYRLIEKIAEGGFGETWKAEHVSNGKLVCLKYALNLDPEDEAFLISETALMWDLRHYSIPAVRGLLRMPDNKLALVMSYIQGPTLAQLIEKHYPEGLDAEHVAWIVERILNVCKYLHMHGVVHGDIKPQNIIVEPDTHTCVLVDYGLSQIKPTRKSTAKGFTPYFAAPEQYTTDPKTHEILPSDTPPIPESDLYGLGMTAIFALGGDVANIKVPSTVPANMVQFLKNMIRRDPLKRPKVWQEDLCETIKEVRQKDFGRTTSAMKALKVS